MKNIFKPGDTKRYTRTVQPEDVAAFHGQVVHPVCATFALARDIEWTTRQFVLDMREAHEEGVGTFLSIDHKGPAFVGEEMVFSAWVDQINHNEMICFYEVHVDDRLIALGKTGQKILKRETLDRLFKKGEG